MFLGCVLPLILATAGWIVGDAFTAIDVFEIAAVKVTVAHLAGLVLWVAGLFLFTKPLVSIGAGKSLVLLVIAMASALGGILVAQASITVFRSGEVQVKSNQDRLDLDG